MLELFGLPLFGEISLLTLINTAAVATVSGLAGIKMARNWVKRHRPEWLDQ